MLFIPPPQKGDPYLYLHFEVLRKEVPVDRIMSLHNRQRFMKTSLNEHIKDSYAGLIKMEHLYMYIVFPEDSQPAVREYLNHVNQ